MLVVVTLLSLPPILPTAAAAPHSAERKSVSAKGRAASARYGVDMTGCAVDTFILKSGQTFSSVLTSYGMPLPEILKAAKQSRPVFNTRRMVAGRSVCVVRDPAKGMSVRYFIYEGIDGTYAVFDFGSPSAVRTGNTVQATKRVAASGTISQSLWHAVQSEGLPSGLVDALSDLFAGKVNFRKFRKGDTFHVLFEEKYSRNGKPAGIGDIQAAVLTCGGKRHQAFRFTNDGASCYYDENGVNLENAFLPAPLKYTEVSSGFSSKRLHPIRGKYLPHPAIDYAAPTGTPVMSVGDGVVESVGSNDTLGKFVKILHPGSYVSQYAHLSAVAAGVRKNARVAKGKVIGRVGSTGLATGPHLDFRFIKKGRYLDYTKLTLPAGEPMQKVAKARFAQQVAQFRSQLFEAVAKGSAPETLDPPERTNLALSPWDDASDQAVHPIR